jgi:serine/threonine-protein kinase
MDRRIADRYLLGEQIGRGGTSRVHAALDERLGRRVAVKLLHTDLVQSADPAGRERFLREGPTSAAFHHRHAVTVFDAGEDGGDLYIVMQLVDGPSLAEVIANGGPLPVEEATRITGQILEALTAAHASGIVHRDVKPANILLAANGDALLTDFGIAKRFDELESSVTRTGTLVGTPRYLSPEQAAGQPAGPASDVYSMGLVLFEMLTGRSPFPDGTSDELAAARRAPGVDVRDLRPEVPEALAATVARALEVDPAQRFRTAAAMGAALASAWSPPAPALPESAILTQVIEAAPAVVGIRSGDTQVMPSSVGADAEAVAATTDSTSNENTISLGAVLLGVLVVVLLVGAWLYSRRSEAAPSSAASSTSPTTTIASSTTGAPQTVVSVTTLNSPVTLDEIIPGFARTADLRTFQAQLASNPRLVGAAGSAIADELGALLDERSTKQQREQALNLRRRLQPWVDADELDPVIAAALSDLLAPLADKAKG